MGGAESREVAANSRRISRQIISFNRLVADVREASKLCGDTSPLGFRVRFTVYTKLKNAALVPFFWRFGSNCVVAARILPRYEEQAVAAGPVAPRLADPKEAIKYGAVNVPKKDSGSSSKIEVAQEGPVPAKADDDGHSHVLSVKEFYYLFLFLVDHLPEVARYERAKLLHAQSAAVKDRQRRRRKGLGDDDEEEEEEEEEKDAEQKEDLVAAAVTSGDEDEELCSVCLDRRIELVLPECAHAFCQKCMRAWAARNNSCPLCRNRVDPDRNEPWVLEHSAVVHSHETQKRVSASCAHVKAYIEGKVAFGDVINVVEA